MIPGRPIPLVDAGVARIRAIGSVLWCPDGDDVAIAGEGNLGATAVASALSINVVAALHPSVAIPGVDAGVA